MGFVACAGLGLQEVKNLSRYGSAYDRQLVFINILSLGKFKYAR